MINAISRSYQQKPSFGRALTTEERRTLSEAYALEKDIFEIPDLVSGPGMTTKRNNTTLILPDFYAPGRTIASKGAMSFIELIKDMVGINSIQALPRGPISEGNRSPFSSSPFELGEQTIDIEKYSKKYGESSLRTGYEKFQDLPKDSQLRKDFEVFKQENSHFERFGILEALASKREYGTDDWTKWTGEKAESDKDLFNYDENREGKIREEIKASQNREQKLLLGKELKEIIKKKVRQNEIKAKYAEDIDFYQYKQFIARQQHQELKANLNEKGLKFFGDCLIGFSPRDLWVFKAAFDPGKTLGAINDNKQFSDWKIPCLDFSKLRNQDGSLGIAGRLIKKKFDTFFDNYDGARIDAGWQLSHPMTNKGGEVLGDKLLDIMRQSLQEQKDKGHNIPDEDIMIEQLGTPNKESIHKTKNQYPHIQTTNDAGNDWGRVNFYTCPTNDYIHDEKNPKAHEHIIANTGYKQNGITIGVGCHDNAPLIGLEAKKGEQGSHLYATLNTSLETPTEFRDAKFAEIFTARNSFSTASDAVGDGRRLNNPEDWADPGNWTASVTDKGNPEEFYFRNLSEGKGLNAPRSRAIAIRAKMPVDKQPGFLQKKLQKLLEFYDKAARIIGQGGETAPYTTEEADRLEKTNSNMLGELLGELPEELKPRIELVHSRPTSEIMPSVTAAAAKTAAEVAKNVGEKVAHSGWLRANKKLAIAGGAILGTTGLLASSAHKPGIKPGNMAATPVQAPVQPSVVQTETSDSTSTMPDADKELLSKFK